MAADQHRQETHRSGPLKQQNKAHKHGRHRTKGQIDIQQKGRVSVKVLNRKSRKLDRQQRRNQARQIRQSKKQELLEKKRHIGTETGAPHVIAVLPLSSTCDVGQVLSYLSESDESIEVFQQDGQITLNSIKHRQRFTLVTPHFGDLYAVLDAAKAADTLLFVIGHDAVICDFSERCFACLLAQGFPSTNVVIQGLEDIPLKKRSDAKKKISKILERWLPDAKLHSLDNKQDASLVLRQVANQKRRTVFYRDQRPYLLGQDFEFTPDVDSQSTIGTLKVSGFLRGKPLDVNKLIHIPGYGDFQMSQIDLASDPFLAKHLSRKHIKGDVEMNDEGAEMEEDIKVLCKASAALQESLESEVIPDPMEGEQTWPDEEELREAEEAFNKRGNAPQLVRRVPKGTSDYQAAWIVDSEGQDGDNAALSEEEVDTDEEQHHDMMESEEESEQEEKEEDDDEYDTISVSTAIPDEKYDQNMDLEEEQKQLEKYRAERENEMFPDEVDTPIDLAARVRFQRYRGLKSFRTSPWDPKENLPSDYSRLFGFENFTRSKKRILKDDSAEGAMPGWYITVHLRNVPKQVIDSKTAGCPLLLFGLLPHEQKMTVMHFVIQKHQSFSEPIRSKDILIYHCAFRRFHCGAIFSQHTTGNKFKFERFLPHDNVVVATLYAPVLFPPAPVLVFTESHQLVATGTVYKADPDRIVAKKIVLSGHPYKILKKKVIVRYMFFNREDILWFKPVELYTKYGRRGHIREPLGTHGHMKCVFDAQIKAQDTVCMSLYKRIYPKWTYEESVSRPPVQNICSYEDEDSTML